MFGTLKQVKWGFDTPPCTAMEWGCCRCCSCHCPAQKHLKPDVSASGPYCNQGHRWSMRRSAEGLAVACHQQRPLWTHTRRRSCDTRVSTPLPLLTTEVQIQKKESAHCGTFTHQMLYWYGRMWANGTGLSYIWIFISNNNAFISE